MLDPDFHTNSTDYGHAAGIMAALARGQTEEIAQRKRECADRQDRIEKTKRRLLDNRP